jgi:N-acyl-phosphatidylethanolamine-hydrolysing phospholipase D
MTHRGDSFLRRLAALAICGVAVTAIAMDVPSHHTGDGFRNLEPFHRAGPLVTVPFFVRRVVGSLFPRPGAARLLSNDGAWLRDNARHSAPSVTWMGHASVLVQMDHVTLLTDPIWSATASPLPWLGPRRFVPPPMPIYALPPIDAVLISHSHYDHLDLPTLRALAARGATRFLVPLRVGEILRAEGIGPIEELDWWESTTVGDVTVTCVPARHWSQRGLGDLDRTLWAGWVAVGPTRRFWFAGDTGYTRSFVDIGERFGPFDLAALPIGAYSPPAMMQPVHLDPEEALQAGLDARATTLLGVHYGTFDLTDEPLDEPPRRFHAAAVQRGIEAARIWTPAIGETRSW